MKKPIYGVIPYSPDDPRYDSARRQIKNEWCKKHGLCCNCARRKSIPGKNRCQTCVDKEESGRKALRKLYVSIGLCKCGRERESKKFKNCNDCRTYDANRQRKKNSPSSQ